MVATLPPGLGSERLQGFRVQSPEGHLGFLERVWPDPDTGSVYLAVRAGRTIVLLVPAGEVESISVEAGIVVLGRPTTRLVAEQRGERIVLRPPYAPTHIAA
jgi:hypothetical protein